jgi:glycerol kinase
MNKFILAIDQGTTGTTVAIVDEAAVIRYKVNFEFEQIYPQPGWVEHDPEKIWASVLKGIQEVVKQSHLPASAIQAIGITNQRETVVVWDQVSGQPIYNAIVWQCRRTTDVCNRLKARGLENSIRKKTGLLLDPYFSASKIQWILDHVPGARTKAKAGSLRCGTIDSFLLWRLTSGQKHQTDVSNASRTQLMNLKSMSWDSDLLKIFKIPATMLPKIAPSNGEFGQTKGVNGLRDGIPICGIAGDQQAALFGQACFSEGEAKCTFGTGSFLLMNAGSKLIFSKAGLLTTVAWQLRGDSLPTYALEGGAFICGAAVQFLRDQMQFIKTSSEIEALAASVQSTDGVEFVPALTGLGAPHWQPEARGLLCGLTRGTTRAHIARATLEAMAMQNVDILLAMEKDLGRRLKRLRVDGGAAADGLLMQMQSDFLGTELDRPQVIETTVAGAAYLAGLGCGLWTSKKEIAQAWRSDQTFRPQLSSPLRKKRLVQWHLAIKRAALSGDGGQRRKSL